MKPMISLSRITAMLALAVLAWGCTPSQMKEEGRFYLSDAGLLDRYQITRRATSACRPTRDST